LVASASSRSSFSLFWGPKPLAEEDETIRRHTKQGFTEEPVDFSSLP
jgi:hypothetical protein